MQIQDPNINLRAVIAFLSSDTLKQILQKKITYPLTLVSGGKYVLLSHDYRGAILHLSRRQQDQ